ncbi:MAG: hemolysin III family protein [Bernardetiaceae bacterium]|nr:hemolysin III family protein [Bernardetiaceae bacterium]
MHLFRNTSEKNSVNSHEELANAITHAIGVILSLLGGGLLIDKAIGLKDHRILISFIIYGSSVLFLFLASTLYHSFTNQVLKKRWRVIDHIGIYLMIAGTYTPFAMVTLKGWWGNLLLGLVWSIAIAGIIFKIFFTGKLKLFSTASYLVMGWIAVIAVKPLYETLHFNGLLLMVVGGLLFSAGVIFYLRKKGPFNHAIWHLFVLGGSICHFFAIFLYSYPQ